MLIAQHDAITGKLGKVRLPDGTPVPVQKLREIACEAEVLPAIFRGASQPLDLGRARWVASPAHHIIHWIDGGPTNLDSMCLLCSRCHHKVHDDGWQVRRASSGKYSLRPPPTHHMPPPGPRNHPYRGLRTTKRRK